MPTLNDIVKVDMSLNTSSAFSRADFETLFILGTHSSFTELERTYTSASAGVADGLPEALQEKLNAAFSQTPTPAKVRVGRREITSFDIVVSSVIANGIYTVTVNGTDYNYTAGATPTNTDIATGIDAATISADISIVDNADGTLTVTYVAGVVPVKLSDNLAFANMVHANSITDDIVNIEAAGNAIYAIAIDSNVNADILAVAGWAEANEKLFIAVSNDPLVKDQANTSNVAAILKAGQYFRTAMNYSNASTSLDTALAGRCLGMEPGSGTWALKRLAGVTADKITETEKTAIEGNNCNYFAYFSSEIALTNQGKVAAGEWIDIIRGRDWLQNTIQTNMATAIAGRDKITYTDEDITYLVANLKASLEEGVATGFIAPDEYDSNGNIVRGYEIKAPLAADVPVNIKASRKLYIEFNARPAGAIHMASLSGSLSYFI